MAYELIQIVDEQDQTVGVASITDALGQGLLHRTVRVVVEDERGRMLLQKRSANMTYLPGCWDCSAAGHVDAGEDHLTAAKRELVEEIGVQAADLTEVGYYRFQNTYQGRQIDRFVRTYRTIVPGSQGFTLQPDEVAEVQWFTVAECRDLVRNHPELCTEGLAETINRHYF